MTDHMLKYGFEKPKGILRNEEIRRLREEENLTYQVIGEMQDPPISRQRVGQILGSDGKRGRRLPKTDVDDIRASEEPNDVLAKEYGVSDTYIAALRKDTHYLYSSGNGRTNQEWVLWFSDLLTDNGIGNEVLPNNSLAKIAVGDQLIDVRVCTKERNAPSGKCSSRQWRWIVLPKVWDAVDFIVFVIAPLDDVFVVPKDIVPRTAGYVSFVHPRESNAGRKSKYSKYLNRFDLLKEK